VKDPARSRIERISPVHGAAIVPEDKVAGPPNMRPAELFAVYLNPQLIKERF
jgi:hypothetical protein